MKKGNMLGNLKGLFKYGELLFTYFVYSIESYLGF